MMAAIFALASMMQTGDKVFAMSIVGVLALIEAGILYLAGKTIGNYCPLIFSVQSSNEWGWYERYGMKGLVNLDSSILIIEKQDLN